MPQLYDVLQNKMKNLTTIVFALLFVVASSFAEEGKALPDFSKAFAEEKLWSQTQMEEIETYSYATDRSFKELKKRFTKYLGESWKELKIDEDVEAEINKSMAENDMQLSGNIIYTNDSFPDVQVGLTQMEMDFMGKSYLVNVTVMKNAK